MHHVPALIGPRSFASSCLCGGIAAAQPTATTTTPPPQSLAAATATRRHSVAACAAAARQRGSLAPADAAAAQQELPSAAFGQVGVDRCRWPRQPPSDHDLAHPREPLLFCSQQLSCMHGACWHAVLSLRVRWCTTDSYTTRQWPSATHECVCLLTRAYSYVWCRSSVQKQTLCASTSRI